MPFHQTILTDGLSPSEVEDKKDNLYVQTLRICNSLDMTYWRDTYSPMGMVRSLDGNYWFTFCVEKVEYKGIEEEVFVISKFYVKEEHRRKGLFSNMLLAFCEIAEDSGEPFMISTEVDEDVDREQFEDFLKLNYLHKFVDGIFIYTPEEMPVLFEMMFEEFK